MSLTLWSMTLWLMIAETELLMQKAAPTGRQLTGSRENFRRLISLFLYLCQSTWHLPILRSKEGIDEVLLERTCLLSRFLQVETNEPAGSPRGNPHH